MTEQNETESRRRLVGFLKGHPAAADQWAPQRAPTNPPPSGRDTPLGRLNNNRAARWAAAQAGLSVGSPLGVTRGAYHDARDLAEMAPLAEQLANPARILLPDSHGQIPAVQYWEMEKGLLGDVKSIVASPRKATASVKSAVQNYISGLMPDPARDEPTLAGVFKRNLKPGANQGELGFHIGSLAYGGAELQGLKDLGYFSKLKGAERYLAAGLSPQEAEHFSMPYEGMGHHSIRRSAKKPDWMGGGPWPRSLIDSPRFLVKPQGMDRGTFYKLHYMIDPDFHGGRLPDWVAGKRSGFSGKRMGWSKYGPVMRTIRGTTTRLKAEISAGLAGAGWAADQILSEGDEN